MPYNRSNRTEKMRFTPVITAGAYLANDVVGGLMAFRFGGVGFGGILRRIKIVDDGDIKAALNLYFFSDEPPTDTADNAPFVLSKASLDEMDEQAIAVLAADYVSVSDGSNNNAIAIKDNLNIDFLTTAGTLYLYAVTATGSTPTYAAVNDLTFELTIWMDT